MTWLGLSVRPPWSWAIAHGGKDVENRSGGAGRWRRAVDAHLMIHASGGWSRTGSADPRVTSAYDRRGGMPLGGSPLSTPDRVAGFLVHGSLASPDPAMRIQHGAVVAVASCLDVHDAGPGCCESEWAEYRYTAADGGLRTDVVHLVLGPRTALPFDGITAKGRLGLWNPAPELVEDVEDMLGW